MDRAHPYAKKQDRLAQLEQPNQQQSSIMVFVSGTRLSLHLYYRPLSARELALRCHLIPS
jgi:hypothetical protein